MLNVMISFYQLPYRR